jgi:hypothetical protein
MDNLVLYGAAGIAGLFLAGVVLLFVLYSVAGLMYTAFMAGSYDMLLIITGVLVLAVSFYMATGYWLQKTDRI